MQKKSSVGVIIILLCLCFSSLTLAETIILKSGQTIKGEVVEKTQSYIKVDVDGITLTYFSDEIERIEKEKNVEEKKIEGGVLSYPASKKPTSKEEIINEEGSGSKSTITKVYSSYSVMRSTT